ncbi:MAG: T9SS type A sorting domain-containing protein [Bacteroidota bacterium]
MIHKKILLTIGIIGIIGINVNAQTWSSVGTGMNNFIFALATDTINNILYAGGGFSTAGGVQANNIAKWDGVGWDSVGTGTDNTVNSFAFYNSELQVGGQFSNAGGNTANGIAKWDGINWSNLSLGMNGGNVYSLITFNGDLYAGGVFIQAGLIPANYIAKWDGLSWDTVGSGMSNAVNALTIYNGELYAGGLFVSAGGDTVNRIARWDGVNWNSLGSGLINAAVYSLIEYNGELYVGGMFNTALGSPENYIAKWDGSVWSSVGTGVDSTVFALCVYHNELYAGGLFTTAGGITASHIAKWNGISWDSLGSGLSGLNSQVRTLEVYNDELYVGGVFTTAGGDSASNIAKLYMPIDSCLMNMPIINNVSTSDVTCNGYSNGTASVFVSGGTTPYIYIWLNSLSDTIASSDSIAGLTAGTYSVIVTDSSGCTANDTVIISQPPALTASMTKTNVSCYGGNNGTATANPSGGTSPYTYLWCGCAGSQTTQTATGLSSGGYSVTVTDANGCSVVVGVSITQPSQLSLSVTSTGASCNGYCDGTATAVASGGTAPYSYLWDDPGTQTGSTATGLCAGTYNVTVTDTNGCIDSDAITITQPDALIAPVITPGVSCYGGNDGTATVNPSGGTSPYTYLWCGCAGSQTTQTATGLTTGGYSLTVTDANGCTAFGSVFVTQPQLLTVAVTSNDMTCNGICDGSATAVASGGTAPYSYLWDDPGTQTGSTATGLCAGTYNILVIDSLSCSTTTSVIVTEPSPITLLLASTPAACWSSDGTATVTASGGTGSYTYSWTPVGGTSDIATGLAAGIYTVTVSDSNGCSQSDSVAVGNTGGPAANITSSADVNCFGNSNGQATVTASGGTTPYTYLWSPSGGNGVTATGLVAGTYNVTVTDASGCIDSDTITITQPDALIAPVITPGVSCYGGNDGTATVNPSGGTSPYTYQWCGCAGSQTTQTATGLTTGGYSLTVTDANGCTAYGSIFVTQPQPLTASVTFTDLTCNGICDGSATAIPSGGTAPYSYLWDDPATQTDSTATGLCAGTYNVTVTDTFSCTTTAQVNLTEPSPIALSLTSNPAACGISDGSAAVTVTGGIPPYYYIWNDPAGQTNSTATGLPAGIYTVTVTDFNGCLLSASIAVVDSDGPDVNIASTTGVSCFGGGDGEAIVTVSGGTSPYTYTWYPVCANNDTVTGLSAGGYTCTVTDAGGCISIVSITITEPDPIIVTVSNNATICIGESTLISAFVTGGTQPYIYIWDNGLGNGSAHYVSPSTTTTYTVIVIDSNLCTGVAQSITVAVETCSSVEELEALNEIIVYPNPNAGEFTIEMEIPEPQNLQLNIINILGQEIFSEYLANVGGKYIRQIKLSDHSTGIYNLQIQNNSYIINKKIIIE